MPMTWVQARPKAGDRIPIWVSPMWVARTHFFTCHFPGNYQKWSQDLNRGTPLWDAGIPVSE